MKDEKTYNSNKAEEWMEKHFPGVKNHSSLSYYNVIQVMTQFANSDKEWVSVKDRLPEDGKWVLAGGEIIGSELGWSYVPVFCVYEGNNFWPAMSVGRRTPRGYFTHVTHWQSLPNPPKAKR